MKDPFREKPITKYTPKDVICALEHEVDQIAPKAAAQSIDALQKWAVHTADIPQGPHRRNEINIAERVRDHYVDEDLSLVAHKELDSDASAAPTDSTLLDTTSSEHVVSPTGSLYLDIIHSVAAPDAAARPTKRYNRT